VVVTLVAEAVEIPTTDPRDLFPSHGQIKEPRSSAEDPGSLRFNFVPPVV